MKADPPLRHFFAFLFACAVAQFAPAAEPFPLLLRPSGSRIELSWPAGLTNAGQPVVFPEYTIERSTDLKTWKPIGGKVRGIEGLSGPVLSLSLDRQQGSLFYRAIANLTSQA